MISPTETDLLPQIGYHSTDPQLLDIKTTAPTSLQHFYTMRDAYQFDSTYFERVSFVATLRSRFARCAP